MAQFSQIVGGRGHIDRCPGHLWGLVRRDGSPAHSFEFQELLPTSGTLLIAKREGRYLLLTQDGNPLNKESFDWAFECLNGKGIRVKRQGNFGLYSVDGKILAPVEFESVADPEFQIAPVRSHGKWGWIDLQSSTRVQPEAHFDELRVLGPDLVIGVQIKEKELIGFHRDGTRRFNIHGEDWPYPASDGLFYTRLGGRLCYFDADGKSVTAPPKAPPGPTKLDTVIEKGKWGVKNANGEWVFPPIADVYISFSGDRALIVTHSKVGLIDLQGHWVIPAEYDSLSPAGQDGGRVAQKDGVWKVLDAHGRSISLPGSYCTVLPFLPSGLAPACAP